MVRRRRSHRYKKEPSKRMWVRAGIGVLVGMFVGLVLVGVWYGTRHPTVTITEVSVSGGETISHEMIRDLAWQELEGAYFMLVPHQFTYLFPKKRIQKQIGDMSRVSHVSISRISRTEIRIAITEYIPSALWCTFADETFSNCLLIDTQGYAFDKAPPVTGYTMLRYAHEGRVPVEGENIFSEREIVGTQDFVEALQARHGMRVYSIERTEAGDLKYYIADGGYILVANDVALEDTFDSLDAVLSAPDFSYIEPGNFAYIDVRFDGAVYIKDVEEIEEVVPEDVATSTVE